MRQTARRVTVACCAWLAALAATPPAMAAFPDQPIKMLVGFPAGSTADLLARALGQKLASQMGQPVIVDNRAGAGSSIAAEAVAHARGDGYTLLVSTTANVINPAVTTGLKFDFARDLVPVALLAENPAVMIVPGNSSYAHLGDLINAARATPGKMTFASSGNGTFTHLYGELFNQLAGVKLTHVPYKGSTQAMTDVISGVVDLSFTPATPVLGQIKSGKLKALAVVAKKRMNSLPEVPTFAEAGIPGLDTALWFGLNAPAGTPKAVIDKLAAESQKALASADVQAQMAAQGIDVSVSSPAQFGELITRELKQWAQVVKTAGVKID